MRFIDSMSFFQMKLAKFPKTFRTQKRVLSSFVQHRYHQTYVGSLPDQHYYMPDGMSVDDRDAFRRWHDKLTREGYMFDFRHELLEYCKSDVLLLKQGCMTFKREFEAKAGFDPFDQMTACNRYLRPLDPRDAFFGGRTNAYQLYRHVEGDERILYYDFKSLYPYVNKYCR